MRLVRAGRLREEREGAPPRALRDPRVAVPPGTALQLATPPSLRLPAAARPLPPRAGRDGWRALAPALPWQRGRLGGGGAEALAFEQIEAREGVALYRLAGEVPPVAIRRALAEAGAPVLADVHQGGRLVAGGLRLAPAGAPLAWPDEPVFPQPEPGGDPPALHVSAATLEALSRGHPWVLADRETGDRERFAPGGLVTLRARRGRAGPVARVEPDGPIAARVVARDARALRARPIAERVAAALERRAALLAAAGRKLDAFRLVHAEADGLPGLYVDRLGPALRALVVGYAGEAVRAEALAALRAALEPACVIEVVHLPSSPAGRLECVRLASGRFPRLDAEGRLEVREAGLVFAVDPGLAEPARPRAATGLFLDQRENRTRVAERVRTGGRYLNLFAHTGAFSARLLRAGAAEVVSVDLSAAYLRWLKSNLAANGLLGREHRSVRGDGRRFLERRAADDLYDGIVLDPPTAAAAGKRFFRARRELPALVAQALAALGPGGFLLVTRHERAARGHLAELVRAAAREAGVKLAEVEPAPPGPDFPSLRGFPEGDAFEGVIATRAL